ncbi:MAG: CDP-2,3-bis-(O-geranylgeranyl)-sn-glycerol synthase [Candidatus Micrarchaeia archaeon]
MNALFDFILYPLFYILPAYIANGAPVIFGGGKPLDFGKKIGKSYIFGPNKTIRGLAIGIMLGIATGTLESILPGFSYMLVVGVLESFGTHLGDLTGSFVKRRLGMESGSSMVLMDQYLFFVFALAFAYPAGNMPNVYGLLFLVILTGILHKLTNAGAYVLNLKKVPW